MTDNSLISSNEQGPLWIPTLQVERMMRECKESKFDTVGVDRKTLEGLLYDSLLWRAERAALSQVTPPSAPETSERQTHTEADGCPTEVAVLKRFWHLHQSCLNAETEKAIERYGPPLTEKPSVVETSPPLPDGWTEHQRHYGEYIEARRGNESAMFHLHALDRPPVVRYCTWIGRDVQCEACGNGTRLPEKASAEHNFVPAGEFGGHCATCGRSNGERHAVNGRKDGV